MAQDAIADLPTDRRRRLVRRLLVGLAAGVVITLAAVGSLTAWLYSQGHATPAGGSEYVALGSSFGAGPGITRRAASSPMLCLRSEDNYAHQLARLRTLDLTDMTCSGAVTKNILNGGQDFQGPQVDAVKANTRLVTITVGGNDVFYLGNLYARSCAQKPDAVSELWKLAGICKAHSDAEVEQAFDRLTSDLKQVATEIRRRAPRALVVYVDYTTVLPDEGSCASVPLTPAEFDRGRAVATRLGTITAEIAAETQSELVKASETTHGHDLCSTDPWVSGFTFATTPLSYGPLAYHPTLAAMTAISDTINKRLPNPLP